MTPSPALGAPPAGDRPRGRVVLAPRSPLPPRACRECGEPDPYLREGLCRRCVRRAAEEAGRAAAEELAGRPAPLPPGAFDDPAPPGDLFDEDE